jgi:hypothetical protein
MDALQSPLVTQIPTYTHHIRRKHLRFVCLVTSGYQLGTRLGFIVPRYVRSRAPAVLHLEGRQGPLLSCSRPGPSDLA